MSRTNDGVPEPPREIPTCGSCARSLHDEDCLGPSAALCPDDGLVEIYWMSHADLRSAQWEDR